MQLVETETSPAAAPPAGACGARLPAPLSAHPQLDQAHHLHGPPRPPGMQRWRGSWTTLQVDHSHPVQLRTKSLRKPPRRRACLCRLWTCWTTLQVDHMPTAACCVLTTCPPNSLLKIPPKDSRQLHPLADARQPEGGGREQWAKRSLTPVARGSVLCPVSAVGRRSVT